MSGTGSKKWEYGGHGDGYLTFNTGKMGLWEGGVFRLHAEGFAGALSPNLGGVLSPSNLGMKLPLSLSTEDLDVTAISFSQKIGDNANLMIGKINTVDLLAGDPFFGGAGTTRFFNLAFAAPPTGLTPGVVMGGLLSLATPPFSWTLMVYDPNDRTSDYWPDDLFADGVNVSMSSKYSTPIAGRTSSIALSGIYSTKDSVDLGQVLLPAFLQEPGIKSGSWQAGIQFAHFLYENPAKPGDGWGLFLKAGISDGNPNPFQGTISGGIGGKSFFKCRPNDTWGLGYFYYNLSDDLQDELDPLLKIDDEQGVELYYNLALTPWFILGFDLQYVNPGMGANKDAFIGGLRARIRF